MVFLCTAFREGAPAPPGRAPVPSGQHADGAERAPRPLPRSGCGPAPARDWEHLWVPGQSGWPPALAADFLACVTSRTRAPVCPIHQCRGLLWNAEQETPARDGSACAEAWGPKGCMVGVRGGPVVHMGCLPLGSAGVPGSRLHPGRHVQEWSPKAAVRGAQEKGVLLWDEGARPVQLGWRDMLWKDRQVRMGAARAAGRAPPRPPRRGTAASRCTEYLLPRGTRTDGQRAGRRGGGVLCA